MMNNAKQRIFYVLVGLLGTLPAINAQASTNVSAQLERYASEGIAAVDSQNGARLWMKKNGERSCSSCHGNSPLQMGKHVTTGKAIQPMAVSVNPERYANTRKVEKWFKRNCKWTFGRECSAQEKADILSWLGSR